METHAMRGEAKVWALGLVVGLCAGASCWRPADGHCGNLDGDSTCAERGGGAYCDACRAEGDGCTDVMPSESCYFPGTQGSSSSGVESTSSGPETSDTSSSSSTGPAGCVSNEDCPDPATPVCDAASGECVACDGAPDPDAACAELDPELPYCVGGACVQCTSELQDVCTAMGLGCDEATNTCVPCTEHAQCAGGAACNLFTGECLPPDVVVHVGVGQDFATLLEALVSVMGAPAVTVVVHEGPVGPYTDTLDIGADTVVAFLAAPGVDVVWSPSMTRALTVTGGTVLIDGIDFTGGLGGDAVLAGDQARLWIDRARMIPIVGGAGISGLGGEFVLRNGMITTTSAQGVTVATGAIATVLYSSLVRTGDPMLPGPAMVCAEPLAVSIRNSIVLAVGGMAGSELSCPTADVQTSALETQMQVGEINPTWFVELVSGDLHLTELGITTFANLATWQSGDPPVDFDGDPRPAVEGTPDFPGADVP